MKRNAIFLDRDGTINIDKEYLYRIEDFEFIPDAIEALRLLQSAGYLLIVITNQSGIARGYYTLQDFYYINEWMIKELEKYGIEIKKTYYCPHHPKGIVSEFKINCDCRKPKLGLYKQAVTDFDIDLNGSFSIGDKIRDCSVCKSTPCRGYLISTNEKEEIIQSVKAGKIHNVDYAKDLMEATTFILKKFYST